MLKIGIIGCGKISERHLMAYRKLPVEIVMADIAEDQAAAMAERFGVAVRSHTDEVLKDPDIAAVDICVPTAYHRDVILQALEHGKHVFCEKPLCRTLEEANDIKYAAKSSNQTLMVGYLQRFHPAFKQVKEALDDEVIGKPYFALSRVGGRGDHAAWKHQASTGGGVILEMLVHKLDQLVWFFGPANEIKVLKYDTIRPIRTIDNQDVAADAEDVVIVELDMGDVKVLCEADFITPSYMDHLEVQGDNGSIFSSLLHFMPTIIYTKDKRGIYNQGSNFYNFPMANLFELELGHFIETIDSGHGKNVNSLEDSIHVMEIVRQIREQGNQPGEISGSRGNSYQRTLDTYRAGVS